MKPKVQKISKKAIVMSVMTALILMIALLLLVNKIVNDALHQNITEEINEKIEQQKVILNMDYENKRSNFAILVESISEGDFNRESILPYLTLQQEHLAFEEIYFIGEDGKGRSTLEKEVDFRKDEVFHAALKSHDITSGLDADSTLQNGVINLASSVYIDGELIGVLLAEYTVDELLEQLAGVVENDGYALIADIEGVELFSTRENFIPLNRLYDSDVVFEEGMSAAKIQEDLTNKRGGIADFTVNNLNLIAVYEPLDFNDWTIVMVVDEDEMGQTTRLIAVHVTWGSFFVLLIVIGFIWYIWDTKRRGIHSLEKVAYTDELTGLPNLAKLKLTMEQVLKENTDKKYAIIKVDVANFKAINEVYSYEVGNKLLCAFKTISDNVNEGTFTIARIGVDEFIFFAGNNFLEKLDDMIQYYESFFKQIIPELSNHYLLFRYGRYFIEQGEVDINEILNKVNMAHTMAKSRKESVIWNYDDSFKKQVLEQAEIANKMEEALRKEEFVAYLQPKFRLDDDKMIGAEALVRWFEEDGTVIFPNTFIPLFESNGFIVELDKYVLASVCRLLRKWLDEGRECIPISVNFSRIHLLNAKFVSEITEIVDKYNVPHEYIEIELTESTIIEREEVLEKLLESLHEAGFSVAIDDFGAGYSSLGLLKNIKVDTLKLDRSFFINSKYDNRGELVITGIIKLAQSLKLHIVAEGIEESSQVDFLKSVNCEVVQGYFYAKPMSISEFEERYK